MQKVYKLLRNNQETGPFSLEEVLQMNLKPFDLVWVEGRSAAWRYPSEIDSLKPFVAEVPKPESPYEPIATEQMEKQSFTPIESPQPKASHKVFVSLPKSSPKVPSRIYEDKIATSQPITQVAEIDNRYIPQSPLAEQTKEESQTITTNYSRPLNDVEEDYTKWIYNQKSRIKKLSVSKKNLSIAAVLILLIAGGYYIFSKPSSIQPKLSTVQNTVNATPVRDSSANIGSPQEVIAQPMESPISQNVTPVDANAKKVPAVSKKISTNTPTEKQVISQETRKETEVLATTQKPSTTTEDVPQKQTTPQKQETQVVKEKKNKLGGLIKEVFGKKDKKEETKADETVMDDPKPATNRQATRRSDAGESDSKSNAPDNSALMEMIDITSNAPDNWMMGVTGLKITLHNRNNVVLQTTAVQVLYYNESNALLDKKTIYFNNVPAKGKLTLSAPDHKFADHVDFKLLAATAKEDRYATN